MLQCGPIRLDTRAQLLTVHDVAVELTSFEYRLLEYLMMHAGEVVSKSALTDRLYQQDFERDSNVIEVLIGRLRRKLDLRRNCVRLRRCGAAGIAWLCSAPPAGTDHEQSSLGRPAASSRYCRSSGAVFCADRRGAR